MALSAGKAPGVLQILVKAAYYHAPSPLQASLRSIRRKIRVVTRRALGKLRARIYRGDDSSLLKIVPGVWKARLELCPPEPGLRKVEVGSGGTPHEGYIHVDISGDSPKLHFVASGDRLPLPTDWADELISVHMLEHVPPPLIGPTLQEWWRVLRRDSLLKLHTPNGIALARALLSSDESKRFWAIQDAIYGYWLHPMRCTGPDRLGTNPDHKSLFTFEVLKDLLLQAGFCDVTNVTGQEPCYHLLDWAPWVADMCLEVEARKG